MKEEAMRIGGGLLNKMPELKTNNEVEWKKGAGEDFKSLCVLLKGNAIPTRNLKLYSKE